MPTTSQLGDKKQNIFCLFPYPITDIMESYSSDYILYPMFRLYPDIQLHITLQQILTRGFVPVKLKMSKTMFNRFRGNHDEAKTTTIDTSNECVLACCLIFSCNLAFCSANAASSWLVRVVAAGMPCRWSGSFSHDL